MAAREGSYPYPRLVPTAAVIRAEEPLPVRVELVNPAPAPLVGAAGELTLEVEKGVLVSWALTFADVPPGGTCDDAVLGSEPALELPLNVASGSGRLRLVLTDQAGTWLNEASLSLPVVAAG